MTLAPTISPRDLLAIKCAARKLIDIIEKAEKPVSNKKVSRQQLVAKGKADRLKSMTKAK